jgi:hypothetical protein
VLPGRRYILLDSSFFLVYFKAFALSGRQGCLLF